MKLVSGLSGVLRELGKGRGKRNEIGAGHRIRGREGTTLAAQVNPAYELSERTKATGSGEYANGKRERWKRVKRMCRMDWED